MLRSAVGKAMRWGRVTVFLVGLAMILAVVLGIASTAFGANGDFFKVGRSNLASAVSVLTKSGSGPALSLRVGSGAPLAVNSSTKVANLNADKLDGKNSTTIGRELFAVVDVGGTLVRGRGNPAVTHTEQGLYLVKFGSDISKCAYTATLAAAAPGGTVIVEPVDSTTVRVVTSVGNGTVVDLPFHLIVVC